MLNKKSGLIAVLACLSASDLFAGTLSSYAIGDVLLCFRKSGGTNDMVVDLGPVSTYTNLAANTRVSITQYTGNQLAPISTNSLIWSAFTWFDNTVSPANIQYTLFVSNPRPTDSLNTQTQPYQRNSTSNQHNTANAMVPIPRGAYDNFVITNYNGALNTDTAVNEPDNTGSTYAGPPAGESYSLAMSDGEGDYNFDGTFQSDPENTMPSNFTKAGTVARSDFYWLAPGGNGIDTPGVFLGYFELNTNGLMSYVAYPTAPVQVPVIQSITRSNNISYVRFTTGSSGTYTLCGTNILKGGPVTNWPAIVSTPGNGSVNTLQDTTSVSNKFYVITAQ